MSGKKKIWITLCSLLVLGTAAATYLGVTFSNTQINPSLQLNIKKITTPAALENEGQALSQLPNAQKAPLPQAGNQTPVATVPAKATLAQNNNTPAELPLPPGLQETETTAENEASHCGYSGTMIILLLGTDERDEIPYGADAIRFLKVDFTNLTVDCVDLSRDLWVETPALADKKIKAARLGNIFDIVQMSTKGTIKEQYIAATTVLTQTIFDNFGVAPDRYVTLPKSTFVTLVDSLGGMEVDVPQDIDAYKHVILAGKRNLTGRQAMAYICQVQTFGQGDLERNSRQLPYIKAVLARMGEPANMVKLPGLISRLQENFITDLSPVRVASLACMLSQVPRENITFHSLSIDMTSPGPEASLLPDTPKIQEWLQGLLKK